MGLLIFLEGRIKEQGAFYCSRDNLLGDCLLRNVAYFVLTAIKDNELSLWGSPSPRNLFLYFCIEGC